MTLPVRTHVVVVAHDAGGAEIVSAYVRAHRDRYRFTCFVAGPALKIFRKKRLAAQLFDASHFHEFLRMTSEIAFVLAGTGDSGMELAAIASARTHHIKTVAFLDHWVNYRERFHYPASDWESHLPDEIWVGDPMAKKMAVAYFPHTIVRLFPNPFFLEVQQAYKEACARVDVSDAILFMSEPVPYGAERILEALLEFFATHTPASTFIIRFHPRESRLKYDVLIHRYRARLHIQKSRHRFIVDDLARAKLVIGMESVALIAAVLCGKKTISFIPDVARALPLPFPEIRLIRDVAGLEQLL